MYEILHTTVQHRILGFFGKNQEESSVDSKVPLGPGFLIFYFLHYSLQYQVLHAIFFDVFRLCTATYVYTHGMYVFTEKGYVILKINTDV
jgi:hypothetical protein